MDLHKSINAATARIHIAKLRRRDSSRRAGFMAPLDQVDEPDEPDEPGGLSLDPNEALTLDSQKEFLEWMIDSKNHKDNYTEEDVGAVMEDVIEKDNEFLTTSFISFNQDQDRKLWTEFKESGLFAKVFLHPRMCLEEIFKSCLTNGKHLSVKFFLTKFPLYRELHVIILIYIYNILLQPRVLFSFLPILLTYSAFAVMTAYSCRIFIANVDLRFSSRKIIPLMTDPAEYKDYVTRYSRRKFLNIYAVFSIASLCYFLSVPISQSVSDLVTAVCFLFFLISIPMLLLGGQNLFSTLTVILYLTTLSPLQLPFAVKVTALILLLISFLWIVWRNIGKGLALRLSSPIFCLMWGQAFAVSSQFTPLSAIFIQKLILVVMALLIIFVLRKYLIHLLVPSIAGFICSYYLPLYFTYVIVFNLFVFSFLISKLFAKHWIQNWFLSLDPFEVTFYRVLWVVFILFVVVGVAKGFLHTSDKLSKLDWDKYEAKCTPKNGWKDANEAEYQLRCLHLVSRSVSLRGKVLSVSLKSRENSLEYYFNRLQVFYLGDGLACLFGQDALSDEECESWKEEFDEDICKYSKCVVSLAAKFKFEILLQLDSDATHVKVEASNDFRDEIIGLRIGEIVDITSEILNPGSKSLRLKLKCIDKSQNLISEMKCAPKFGFSTSNFIKYLEDLKVLIFNWDV